MEEVLGITGAQREVVTRPRSHSNRGLEMVSMPDIFPPKAEKTRPFKGGGGGGGICPQGSSHGLLGPLSLTTMPSSGLSSLPYSLRKGLLCPGPVCRGPCSPPGMQWEQESPWAETGPGDTARKRRGHSGAVSLAPPRPGSWADWRKGRKRTGRGELSAADSQRAAANAKAKDPVGRGWAVERSCACALGGGRHSRRGSPVGALS